MFASPMAKARWIDGMATLDARLPLVREMARRYVKAYGSNDPERVLRPWHAFCRDTIRYVPDGPGEELSDSEQTLKKGTGDCDDKARLFVAGVRSMKLCPARILPVFEGDHFKHVQAEVFLPVIAGYRDVRASRLGGGVRIIHAPVYDHRWLVAELIVKGVELGSYPPKGRPILA